MIALALVVAILCFCAGFSLATRTQANYKKRWQRSVELLKVTHELPPSEGWIVVPKTIVGKWTKGPNAGTEVGMYILECRRGEESFEVRYSPTQKGLAVTKADFDECVKEYRQRAEDIARAMN